MDAMEEPVPVHDSLDKVYPKDDLLPQTTRWAHLATEFTNAFGLDPTFVARSPGRVNIIGEHVDYSLYDVMPMGIAADVIIAVAITSTDATPAKISLANVDSEKHRPLTFSLTEDGQVEIDASSHEWTNYFKAGLQGALEVLKENNPKFRCVSFSAMVDGTVPSGGGLSSSAAFVCASALAALHANGKSPLTKRELTERAIVSERSVGVNSGGMDQAASVCSTRGHALHVAFTPSLRAEAVTFPKIDPPVTFMIAQSLVTSDKYVTGPVCYNLRVVEVTFAALFLAASFNLTLAKDNGPLGHSLRGFEDAYYASSHAGSAQSDPLERAKTMLGIANEHLTQNEGYTRAEIASKLGISESDLEQRFLQKFPVRAERFLLRQRAEHVFSENERVHRFISLLEQNNKSDSTFSAGEGDILLKQLGELMNLTQASCRDIYDCSCPELDEMCDLARKAGGYGSRLTGAGWGGCSVHLVPRDRVEAVRKIWIEEYYEKTKKDAWDKLSEEEQEACIVVTEPGLGSVVIELGR